MAATRPDKRSFFKYADPNTVLAVLKNQTVRYSSPLKFNDPFDVQAGLHFDFDLDTLTGKIFDKLHELASASVEPLVDKDDPWGKIVLMVREKYQTHGFPRDQLEQIAAAPFAWLVNEIKSAQRKYQAQWRKTLLPGLRVFCVSEDRDNLLMWAHYAKDHTGAVFEFLSLPDEDNPLSAAQPVVYMDRPAPFFAEADAVDHILSIRKINYHELYKRYVYFKSKHWEYEREWRVWYPLVPAPGDLHEDMPIRQSEFSAVYIGCRAEAAFVNEVVSLTNTAFPGAGVYRARKSEDAYKLQYMQI